MLPLIVLLISSSDGFLLVASSAAACMIWPAWQYPHCGTLKARHAFCTGWLPCGSRPSIVVTERPETSLTAVMQARVAAPSTCTVHAPHSATPQPYLVPLSPSSSRKYQSSGIDGSPSNDCSWPLTRNLTMACPPGLLPMCDSIPEGADPATSLNSRKFRSAAGRSAM